VSDTNTIIVKVGLPDVNLCACVLSGRPSPKHTNSSYDRQKWPRPSTYERRPTLCRPPSGAPLSRISANFPFAPAHVSNNALRLNSGHRPIARYLSPSGMTIIVFLIDTSASMCQRTYMGGRPTLLDIAKGAVESFVKV